MSTSFDLPDLDHFITGTVGEPGERVFYLQAVAGDQVFTLRLEKLQVATLAQYLAAMLADIPTPLESEIPESIELIEPPIAEWVVGQIGVAYNEASNHVVVVAEELVRVNEGEEEEIDNLDMQDDAATASFRLTPGQVAAFIRQATEKVSAGRPPCILCGRPMNPEGHVCIKTNGHKPH